MLNIKEHEYYLKRILRDIFSDHQLQTQLAFKGGTCLYLFYNLPRFSVDLDFNLISDTNLAEEKLTNILKKYLDIDKGKIRQGEHSWLCEASYKKGQRKMQIDVNKRKYPNKYILKQFYGLSMKTLAPAYLFSHKLCAITDRKRVQNRDLFDSWFMFDKMFEIDEKIIKLRTNQSLLEYLQHLEKFISDEINKSQILHGLGELIDEKTKHWAKTKLVDELLSQIRLKIDALKKNNNKHLKFK